MILHQNESAAEDAGHKSQLPSIVSHVKSNLFVIISVFMTDGTCVSSSTTGPAGSYAPTLQVGAPTPTASVSPAWGADSTVHEPAPRPRRLHGSRPGTAPAWRASAIAHLP